LGGFLGVLVNFIVENREVQGMAQSHGVGGRQGLLSVVVSLLVGGEGLSSSDVSLLTG
jgi:hypothetical protein